MLKAYSDKFPDGTKLFLTENHDEFVVVTLSGAYDFTNIAPVDELISKPDGPIQAS